MTGTKMQTTTGYQCTHCSRGYKEKFNYDRHRVYCDFLQKSTREQTNELEQKCEKPPTVREMYRWMQEMALRIDKLEKENAKLKRTGSKKINILEWLNNSVIPTMTFSQWIHCNALPIVHNYLDSVYEENLQAGIYKVMCNAIICDDTLPIRAFSKYPNIFYVFVGEKWTVAKSEYIDAHLSQIAHRFIVDFKNHWYTVNQSKIDTDEKYQDLYVEYYKRILGGDDKHSDDERFKKIRNLLYKKLAENLQMIEYELVL